MLGHCLKKILRLDHELFCVILVQIEPIIAYFPKNIIFLVNQNSNILFLVPQNSKSGKCGS